MKERVAAACVCCGNDKLSKSPAVLMPFIAHRVFGWEPVQIDASWGLNTISSGMAYSLCNSLYCRECDFLFLDIRFSEAELAVLYADYRGEAYTSLREKYEPGYQQRNDRLVAGLGYAAEVERFLAPHLAFPVAILDWGGDTGLNSPFKAKRNKLHIYDISHKPLVANAERVNRHQLAQEAYDLIVCSHVLEHVSFPQDLIREIKSIMRKDTLLYIEVPHEAVMREAVGAERQLKKRHWHEHVNFYSESALRRLLVACGFEVIDSRQLVVSQVDDALHCLQVACRLA